MLNITGLIDEEEGRVEKAVSRKADDTSVAMLKRAVAAVGRREANWTLKASTVDKVRRVKHCLDLWHRARKIQSKLQRTAAKAKYRALAPWILDLRNHFWRSAQHCRGDVMLFKVNCCKVTY